MKTIQDQLIEHEGERLKPYLDPTGSGTKSPRHPLPMRPMLSRSEKPRQGG